MLRQLRSNEEYLITLNIRCSHAYILTERIGSRWHSSQEIVTLILKAAIFKKWRI